MPAPANLVHEISTSTGTGNFTVSAQNGKQRFSTAFGTGVTTNVFDYFIWNQDAAEWERGTGHMSAVGTLVRDTVIESSNANAAVNFSVGTKNVTNDVPAGHQVRAELVIADNAIVRGDGGAAGVQSSGITIDDSNNMFLPTGTKIDWAAGDVTITHSANALAFAGAANGYSFDAPLFAANGAVGTPSISFASDPDTGLYRVSANVLGLALGGNGRGIFSALQDQLAQVFSEGTETDKLAGTIFRYSDPGSHTGFQHYPVHIESRPVGSGTNGPTNADYGLSVSVVKQNFGNGLSAATGEMDGISIAMRQGGTASDCGCILGNMLHTGTGFQAFFESITNLAPAPTFTITQAVRLQAGVINNKSPNSSFGYFVSADTGTIDEAFYADTNGGSFTQLVRLAKAGTDVFTIDGNGGATVLQNSTSTTVPGLVVQQSGIGDASIQWLLASVRAWVAGIDNSDGDAWKLGPANDSFATAILRVDTNGLASTAGGSFGRNSPVTKTGNFTVGAAENWIIVNQAATTTVTLPAAASFPGREIYIKTIQAQLVVSAASNVTQRASTTTNTSILAANAGNWAALVSDGTNWVIMAGTP